MEKMNSILFPFDKIKQNSKIVLYGAGDVGQTFYWQIQATKYCEIIGWVDKRWATSLDLAAPFLPLKNLNQLSYDYIVIAASDPLTCENIFSTLKDNGVPEKKIVIPSNCVLNYTLCHPSDNEAASIDVSGTSYARMLASNMGVAWECPPSISHIQTPYKFNKKNSYRYNIAIVGTGTMAGIMAETIYRRLDNARLYAVVSRNPKRAKTFAARYGVLKTYDSCLALAQDPLVDLVHIATPVFLHYEQTLLFLEYGKHVLCEKPFALNCRQAKKMIQLAHQQGLLLADGVWPCYMPMAEKLDEIFHSGIIGKISSLSANLYYLGTNSPRLNTRAMGGGIFLENGSYLLALTSKVFGKNIRHITASGLLTVEGVDSEACVTLIYDNAMAILHCGMRAVSDRCAYFYGDNGFMVVENANEYKTINIYNKRRELVERHVMPSGYEHEVRACLQAIERGACEPTARSHEETLFTMDILDSVRCKLGVHYDTDNLIP